jgi:hypothetical protein
MGLCHEWESKFDEDGAPLPHADVQRFLTDAIHLQYHSSHTHHDSFCIRPTFRPEGVMDFQITHPFACDFWTVCLTEMGAGFFESNSGQFHLLLPGSIALLPPGFVGRMGRAGDSRQWRCSYLGFRPKPRWFDFLTLAFSAKVPVVLKPDTSLELAALRRGLDELSLMRCERGDINERLSFNLIENLLIRLYGLRKMQQSDAGRCVAQAIDARVSVAVDFVLSQYQRPLTLQDIAARANLSPSRLAALFKSHYGIGLIQWRDSIRLSRARDLIATTNLRIAE